MNAGNDLFQGDFGKVHHLELQSKIRLKPKD